MVDSADAKWVSACGNCVCKQARLMQQNGAFIEGLAPYPPAYPHLGGGLGRSAGPPASPRR
jgi:hypothetical protein